MNKRIDELIKKINNTSSLSFEEYKELIETRDKESTAELRRLAMEAKNKYYGNKVYIRGLIEISNICKNDCLYCGIRRSNTSCDRYRLSPDEIFSCCETGYSLGFRTFVMQGGEDPYFSDELLIPLIKKIKSKFPDCAITLSLGERSKESYSALFSAGADRYLLRHETANKAHYSKLHPDTMKFDDRIRCLNELKEIGFQTGCGFMVGSPYQTTSDIANDLKFIEEFSPDMCGIGPFIPHSATPFGNEPAGSVELTCFLLSVIRLIKPTILLPATTALGSLMEGGRELGILSGANVVMPNLSPTDVRQKYSLYNNKLSTGAESAEKLSKLKDQMRAIGHEVVTSRGDVVKQ